MSIKFKSKLETFQIPEDDLKRPEKFQETLSKTNILVGLMHQLNSAESEDQLYRLVADNCFQLFDIEGVSIFVPDSKNEFLYSKLLLARKQEMLEKAKKIKVFQKMPLKTNYSIAQAFLTHKVSIVQKTLIPVMKKAGIKTVVALPIVVNNRCLGVLGLGYGKNTEPAKNDLRIGELLSTHLASSLFNLSLVSTLKTQNEWMQVTQDNIREGFSLIGPNDEIYYTNKTVSKLFGTTGKVIGLKRGDIVRHWEKLHRYKVERFFKDSDLKKTVYEKKKPFLDGLIKVESKPAKFIEANYYPIVQNKKILGMAASYRDITKEKHQEAVLEEQMGKLTTEKERFEAIVSNVEEGICLIDSQMKILHMNSACERTSGWSLKDAKGEFYHKVFRYHTKAGLYYPEFDPMQKVLITKEPTIYEEYLQLNRAGDEFWVGVSASPVLNGSGKVSEIVVVIRDISSLKEVEKAKSEFVSIASHELRTPLTVVNGYLSLLRDGDLGDFTTIESRQRLVEVLDKVSNETHRLTQLVSDLLNVSRIEENRIVLNKQTESVHLVIDQVVDEMSSSAVEKGITISYSRTDNGKLETAFDFDKISQVLINLIDNAMKFTPGGGRVEISAWRENAQIFVKVADNGVGIPSRLLSIIFEKFQQVQGSYLKENRGTGLGLFIVKSLVELHGGEIVVESEIGKGTQITFSLPV